MNLLVRGALCALITASLVSFAVAQQTVKLPANSTVVHVEKMCCKGCAQKIAAQLYVLRGVKEVRYDLKQKVVIVVPQSQKRVSPRSIWEAVVKGKDQPIRLAGPAGTFKAKPRY